MNSPANIAPSFPHHGPLSCRRCFTNIEGDERDIGAWHVVNDPGAWGASNPKVLVLGFSKGFTQANAFKSGKFEDVPFKKARGRLRSILCRIGLLDQAETDEEFNRRFEATERDFAFGSVVRCSLSRMNSKTGRYECTGQVMTKAFSEPVSTVVRCCAQTYLSALPANLQVIILLGTTAGYIKDCKKLIRSIHPISFEEVNDVAYRTDKAMWIHVTHPSGMNGYYGKWMSADKTDASGSKREDAIYALSLVPSLTGERLG